MARIICPLPVYSCNENYKRNHFGYDDENWEILSEFGRGDHL